jgi:hypothetical protein
VEFGAFFAPNGVEGPAVSYGYTLGNPSVFHSPLLTRLISLNQKEREKPGHKPGFLFLQRMASNVRMVVQTYVLCHAYFAHF